MVFSLTLCIHCFLCVEVDASSRRNSSGGASGDGSGDHCMAMACFLIEAGAHLTKRNHQTKSPLDLVTDIKVKEVLNKFALAR